MAKRADRRRRRASGDSEKAPGAGKNGKSGTDGPRESATRPSALSSVVRAPVAGPTPDKPNTYAGPLRTAGRYSLSLLNLIISLLFGVKIGRKQPKATYPKSTRASIIELMIEFVIAIGVALTIQRFLVMPFRVPSGSMEPTLKIGQRYLANRIGMTLEGPHVGEIAVFHPPKSSGEQLCGPEPHVIRPDGPACNAPVAQEETDTDFAKRVIAGPGEWLYIKEGHAYTSKNQHGSFKREHDPYIRPCAPPQKPTCNYLVPIKIPPGHWFMMGDNRGESDDSRFWGPVPTNWFIASVVATLWPPDRIGFF